MFLGSFWGNFKRDFLQNIRLHAPATGLAMLHLGTSRIPVLDPSVGVLLFSPNMGKPKMTGKLDHIFQRDPWNGLLFSPYNWVVYVGITPYIP